MRKMLSKIALCFLVYLSVGTTGQAQSITLDFPSDPQVCESSLPLTVTLDNTAGDTIDNGLFAFDFSATPGVTYTGVFAQTTGPTLTDDGGGVFSFTDELLINGMIEFEIELDITCEAAASADIDIDLLLNFVIEGLGGTTSSNITETLDAPDIDITTSTPNGINGVIGYEFSIDNTFENNGTADADNAYYCVQDNANADLASIEVGGVTVAPSATSQPGFTCFDLGMLTVGGSAVVTENWVITSCDSPQDLFRRASYGCNGDLDCAEEPDSDFPSTILTLVAPTDPISITTDNASELSVCGEPDVITVTIENSNGDDFVTQNVLAALTVPAGVELDYSTLTTISGDPVVYDPGTMNLIIGDLEDGESVTFTVELSLVCGIELSAIDYTVDVIYDELCEGVNNIATEISSQISVLAAEFSILSPLIEGNLRPTNVFDAILGVQDTMKVPMVNAGSGSISEFTYWVVNPGTVENVDVLINGMSLTPAGTSGDTVFYTITSADIMSDHTSGGGSGNGDGLLDENESLVICEVWEGIECDLGTPDPIRRAARYGCGASSVCSQSNISTTGIDYGFALPDLVYSQYAPLIDRPACWSEELTTLAIEITNEGLGIAQDITFDIRQGSNPGSIVGSSIMWSRDPVGPFTAGTATNTTSASGTSGSSGQCVVGSDLFRNVDAFLEDVFLMPDETIYVTYQLQHSCDCRACVIDNIYFSDITQLTWTDPCDEELFNNSDVEFNRFDARLQGFFEGESEVSGSGCIDFAITNGSTTWMSTTFTDDYPDAYFESRLTVECGIDITSAQLINAAGTPYSGLTITQNDDGGTGGDDEVIFQISRNVSGFIQICYNVDCSEKPAGCPQVANLSMENYFFPDPSCAAACEPNVNCQQDFTFVFDCPPCGPCDGLTATELQIERTNYCFLDADNDFIPDDGVTMADATTAKGDRFVQGDSLRLDIKAVVNDSGTPENWEYAFLEFDVQTDNFTILGAEFSVQDESTGMTLTCNSLSQFPMGDLLITDLSVPSMTSLACSDFDGFTYADGDSLCLTVYYSPKEPLLNVQSEGIVYQPDFYLSDAPYDTGTRFSCNFLIETLNQIGIREFESVVIGGRDFGGCDISPFTIRYDLNYGTLGFDEFCNEIRSPGIPEKFTFVKPAELEYSLDDFGLSVFQRLGPDNEVVAMEGGGIPGNFFLESGDTLCFFVKDYILSLGLPEITEKGTDGGYNIYFYPGIRGNCQSEVADYEACAQLLSDVNDQVFCVDKMETDLECEEFGYTGGPTLIVSATSSEVELFEPMSCVTVELNNTSNINAPFSWLNINSITGGLVVTSVTETTGGISDLVPGTDFGVYQLGLTDRASTRTFEICINVTDCERQTLSFTGGWDCTEYPPTVQEATCNDPSFIDFVSVESAYTGQLIKPTPPAEYALCDTVCFIHRFSSTALGNVNDILFDFQLPGGMEYLDGSFEIAYPVPADGTDTTWTFVMDPDNYTANNHRIDVTSLDMTLDSVGLIGSLGALDNFNIVLVRWNAITTCDYKSGSRARFTTTAADLCGDNLPTLRSRSPRLRIRDITPEYEIDLLLSDLTLNPCNEDGATVEIELQIDADPGVETMDSDTIKVTLPPGIGYDGGTYTPVNNAAAGPPTVTDVNGLTCIAVPVVGGLVNQDIINFTIDVTSMDVGQLCGRSEMIIQTFSTTNAFCGTEECSIGVLSGEDVVQIRIDKPDLSILSTDLTLISMPPASASIEYEIKIMNNGLVPQEATNDLVIELWDDLNDNGLLDSLTDNLVVTTFNSVTIPTGGMTLVTGVVDVPPTGICNALAVINPSSACVCNLEVSNQTKVEIENNFDMEVSVCSETELEVGPEPVEGLAYEWISINGSDLGALSETDTTTVDFEFDNNSGTDIVWDYAIRSSFGECFTFDTLQVTVFQEITGTATVPACEGKDVELPGPVSGSNFLWDPSTDLDDPTAARPILDPVPSGSITYNLTYTDDNGCDATKEVIIIGAACAPGTALGDTVWFDLNEDGLQDMGEPGIPDVTVFLYNANNTTPGNHIAVTMTDANGYYIFDDLVAGNYIIEFVMPDGFVYTTTDTGGDDTIDSDADSGTGLTGSYFLPNGTFNPTIDAGFIPDCSLDVEIADISDCIFDGTSHTREVTVAIDWTNAVWTYDFLGGVDTIQLDILGQTFLIEIDTLSGDTTQTVIINNDMPVDLIADIFLTIDDDCLESDTILDIQPCIYDAALIKQVATPGPYSYGDILTYNITVANQGFQALADIKINDFLPSGFTFDPAANPGWMQSAPDTLMYIIDRLDAMETVIVPLDLELIMSSEPGAYLNTSEIFSFTDTLGVDRSDQDIDSTPDNDPSNDGGGAVNTGSDNSLDGDGSGAPGDANPNTDEDDEDPELITVVDLALVKDIITPGPYDYGDVIEFAITVTNQGNVTTQNIKVNDFIPAGFMFDPVANPDWMLMGSIAMDTIPGPLATGESATTTIFLTLQEAAPDQYVNIAEIGYFENTNGQDITGNDIDSQADNDPTNDAGGNPGTDSDGSNGGDGTGGAQDTDADTDEDDSDPAYIPIPQIDLEKSTISVVPAQSGTEGNFDATFEFVITNPGNQKLTCIQLEDDLTEQLGGTFVGITSAPMTVDVTDAAETPAIVMGYNGGVIDTIFNGSTGCLNPNETITVQMTIEVNSQTGVDPIINAGDVAGKSPDGVQVMDTDTALVDAPDCFLEIVCPLTQVDLDCINDIPASGTTVAWFNGIDGLSTIVNSCGIPTIAVNDSNNGGEGCVGNPYILTRQIIVNDPGDGMSVPQSDTCEVVYTIVDDEKPIVMNAPTDLIVECGVDNTTAISNWIATNGGAMFVDACGTTVFSSAAGATVMGCGGTSTTPYTFTGEDQCNNTVSVVANLIVVDNEAPTLILPSDPAAVSCDASPDPDAWAATATATDDCDTAPVVNYALTNIEELCNGTNSQTVYTYIFTAVDACGNQSTSMTGTYTVTDNVAPTIDAPADLMVTCGQDISLLVAGWLDNAVPADNCSDLTDLTITTDFDASTLLGACGATIPVTWTVTDACGATSTDMANIVIADDNLGPVLMCADTLTFALDVDACESNITLPLPLATDCNGVDSVVQISPLVNSAFPEGFTTVTFEAWDGCGNSTTCETVVEIVDTQNPDVVCPPSINECATAGSCEWVADATVNAVASDCGATTLTYEVENPDGSMATPAAIEGYAFMLGSSTVTITATDDSDPANSSTCNFTVTITDCEDPTIDTCPADQLMVECGMEDVTTWAATLVGADFCDTDLTEDFYILTQTNGCGGTSTSTYVFIVTDDAGNSASCTATYTTVDNTPPTLDTPATNPMVNCMEDNTTNFLAWLGANGSAVATDGCSGPVTWTNDWDGSLPTGCTGMTMISVTFTATDDCGMTVTTVGTYTITDTNPPSLDLPANLTLECGNTNNEAIVQAWLASATGTDDCSMVSIISDYTSLPTTCNVPLMITFTGEDECGNEVMDTRTITLDDITNPVITIAPSDLFVQCGMDNTAAINSWITTAGGGTASDNCNTPTITFVANGTTATCGGTSTTEYIFTATDACGNSVSETASLVTIDNGAPILILPTAPPTAACDGSPDPDGWAATASATDICDSDPTVDYALLNIEESCSGTQRIITYTYIFTAVDGCGNTSASQTATFTVTDSQAPTLTPPADLMVSCGQDLSLLVAEWLDDVVAMDNCSDVTELAITNDYDATALMNTCGATIPVTWTVVDGCGATSTATADIVVAADSEGPVMTCTDTLTFAVDVDDCGANITLPLPLATDCNGVDSVKQVSPLPNVEFGIGFTTVTFQSWDACGNTSTCETVVEIVDTQNPELLCPPSINQCADAGTCTWTSDASVNAITSDCGNTTLTYSVLNPDGSTSTPTVLEGYVFALGSSTVTITSTDDADPTNMTTCNFTVTITDCEDPTIDTCPADQLMVECGMEDIATWAATLVGADFCDTDLTEDYYILTQTNACGGTSTSTYVFVVTDDAGNSASCTATYTTVDTTPPTLDTPASNPMVTCMDDNTINFLSWLGSNGGAAASDGCSGPVVWTNDWDGTLPTGCTGMTGIDITFTATDDCGLTVTTVGTYTITDVTAPVLTPPSPLTLECGNENNAGIVASWLTTATATDDCSTVDIMNDYSTLPTTCNVPVTVTFTAEDGCGLSVTETATITLVDTEKPVIMIPPTDLTVECIAADMATQISTWVAAFGFGTAVDNCDTDVTLTFTAGTPSDQCGGTSTTQYTFVAEDDCGNTITAFANLIIIDETAPNLNTPTVNNTVECSADVAAVRSAWLADATGTDDCGGDVTVVYNTPLVVETCVGTVTTITETYTFTATDECGNDSIATADFIIEDNTAPTISHNSGNLEVACGGDISAAIIAWLSDVTVTEACQETTVTNDYDGTVPDLCGGNLTVTWTVTDACGAMSTTSAMLIVTPDQTDPTFVNIGGDLTVNVDVDNCESNVVFSTPTGADCNDPVTIVQIANTDGVLLPSGSEFPVGTTTIVFQAEDACGNTARDSFDITVIDSHLPSLDCPSNDVVNCNDMGECYWTADMSIDAIFADNCGGFDLEYAVTGATVATGDSLPRLDAVQFMLGTSIVTYTLTDTMGNEITCSFNVVIEDCENPTVTCPPAGDLTLECADPDNDDLIDNWIATATYTDNCPDSTIMNVVSFTENMCGNTETRTYTFTATDAAGNTAVCTADVIIEDTMNPTIDTEALDMTVECDGEGNNEALLSWLANNGGAVATDLCGEVAWTHNFTGLSNGCGATGSAIVTFTATDECGRVSTTTATFTIQDTSTPTVTAPLPITLECTEELTDEIVMSWFSQATGSDNCGAVDVTNSGLGAIVSGCGMTGVYTVTFTATDDCGLTATETSTVTIVDQTSPTITAPAEDLVIECTMAGDYTAEIDNWTTMMGMATATDGCSEPLVWSAAPGVPMAQCGNTSTTLYTFTVTDDCGNTATTTASVIITDETAPILTEPADVTVQCEDAAAITVADWIDLAEATDLCSTPTITSVLWNTVSGCGDTDAQTYLFTAEDGCGNIDTAFATYTILDGTPPTITAPADLMITCGDTDIATQITQWLGEATSADGCGTTSVTTDYTGDLPDACGGSLEVVFTASDECGNTVTSTSNIVYTEDTTPPTFVNPPTDITVNVDVDNCETSVVFSTPSAEDCNQPVTVTQIANAAGDILASGDEFPVGTTEIVFEATDGCDNTTTTTFSITVIDSQQPSIACPSNTVTMCTDAGICLWTADDALDPIFNDNCGGIDLSYVITGTTAATGDSLPRLDAVQFELGLSTVTYTLTDTMGNEVSCSFDVLIEDCETPTITVCPANELVECSSADNATQLENWLDEAMAMDNCDTDVTITNDIWNTTSDCGNTNTTTYIFTATDDAGNATTCLADFEITDTTIPVINTDPDDTVVECDGSGNNAQLLAWLQNNGGLTNADVTEDCGAITWSNNFESITFTANDPCDDEVGYYEVNFIATDECGNPSAPVTIQFIIQDSTDPVLSVPNDITLECSDPTNPVTIANWLAEASATDICSDVTVTNDDPGVFVAACAETGVTTYTFTATDDCGNLVTETATVTIVDTEAPIITTEAMDMVVECDGSGNTGQLSTWLTDNASMMAVDSCSATADLVFTNELRNTVDGCEGTSTATYAFIVTDECGNSSESLASFIIEDTEAPTIDVAPEDEVVECDGAGNNAQLEAWLTSNGNTGEASDICGTVTWTYELIDFTDSCGTNGTKIYEFTATDGCGNASTAQATFTIEDTTPPTIGPVAMDVTAECNGASNSADLLGWLNTNGGAVATDVCSGVVWTNNYSAIDSECGADGVVVTFTATDNCGNSSSTTATFTIDDDTPPIWEIAPQDLTIECTVTDANGLIDAWLASQGNGEAEDDCSFITYMNNYVALSDGCGLTGEALVTFTATDGCLNSTTATATITVVDETAPTLVVDPADETVECDGMGNVADLTAWLDNYAGIMYVDGCSGVIDIDSLLLDTEEFCGGTLIYTYAFFATDECGNTSPQVLATFTIEDTTSPTITPSPMDMTVECDGAGNIAQLQAWLDSNGGAAATDICSPTFTWEYDLITETDSCGSTGGQVYRFTVTDDCGNTAAAEATFVIEDTTAPTMVCCPDFTINLDLNGLAFLTVDSLDCGSTDICSDDSQLIRSISKETFNADDVGPNDVTLYVTDECGNIDSCLVVVTVAEMPSIGVAKRVVSVDLGEDGCTEVVYEINVENFGDVTIDSIQVEDDLAAAGFTQCASFTTTVTSDDFTVNTAYNGMDMNNLLTGLDDIEAGDVGAILLTVEGCGCPDGSEIMNSATVMGVSPGGTELTDDSVNGSDPDGDDNDGNPDEDGTTDITLTEMGSIGAAKRVVSVDLGEDGCTEVIYEIKLVHHSQLASHLMTSQSIQTTMAWV